MYETNEHFNRPERVAKWGGESIPTTLALVLAFGLATHGLKTAYPEEAKAIKGSAQYMMNVVTQKITGVADKKHPK